MNVGEGKYTVVMKRGMSTGYAGVENPLFFKDNTRMLFGDAKESLSQVLTFKQLTILDKYYKIMNTIVFIFVLIYFMLESNADFFSWHC